MTSADVTLVAVVECWWFDELDVVVPELISPSPELWLGIMMLPKRCLSNSGKSANPYTDE